MDSWSRLHEAGRPHLPYNRVMLVFRQANNPSNYAAIKSFNLEAADATHTALGTPISAVPEPSSLALLLGGLGDLRPPSNTEESARFGFKHTSGNNQRHVVSFPVCAIALTDCLVGLRGLRASLKNQ